MVWQFCDHQEPRLLLSCSSIIFDTCFHFIVQVTTLAHSITSAFQPVGREKEKKCLSLLFKKLTCDILLMFLCSQWSHLFEEEGEKCNLYSAQLCTQLKIKGSIPRKETRKDIRGQFFLCYIIVTIQFPAHGSLQFCFLISQVPVILLLMSFFVTLPFAPCLEHFTWSTSFSISYFNFLTFIYESISDVLFSPYCLPSPGSRLVPGLKHPIVCVHK